MSSIPLIVITLVALSTPWWVYVIVALAYALCRPSYGLFAVAFIVDVLYGVGTTAFPILYTLITALVVASVEIFKPYVRYYN